jgi:hypothetical protein
MAETLPFPPEVLRIVQIAQKHEDLLQKIYGQALDMLSLEGQK